MCLNTLKKLSYFVNIVKWMFFINSFGSCFSLIIQSSYTFLFAVFVANDTWNWSTLLIIWLVITNFLGWKWIWSWKLWSAVIKFSLWEFKFGYYGSSCIPGYTQFFWGVTFRATVYYNDLYTLSPAFMFSHTLSQIISIIYMHIYI